ncbi:MAG: MBL fold metallo-hydrolase [Acidimicrobiia bacterium]|nr:MBL fold metallo-hydrolase [Acidimicrobiia bacterium]
MRLDILGSSGTAPTKVNPASGYLLRHGDTSIWMDAGPGTYMALLQLIDPAEINAVLLSHMHPDHCTDLFALFHGLKYVRGLHDPVPLIVPDGSTERLRGFVAGGPDHPLFHTFAVNEARPGQTLGFGDFVITPQAAHHSVPAFAYLVRAGGAALGYTGDSGPSSMLVEHFSAVHTLLAEASLPAGDRYPFHMTARQAGELATAADAERLILTHIPESVDASASAAAAAEAFGGELSLAQPGDVYMIESGTTGKADD